MLSYQVTGNEYLSLPTIRETDGAIEGVTFLYMQAKGLLEIQGDEGLIKPYLAVGGNRVLQPPVWTRAYGWIPLMEFITEDANFRCTYLTPVGERAFVLRLEAKNEGNAQLEFSVGVDGKWDRTLHEVNETMQLPDGRTVKRSDWNQMFVWVQQAGLPLFAFAPLTGDNQPFSEFSQDAVWSQDGFNYDIHKTAMISAGESLTFDIYFGLGYEEVAAVTSTKELLRQGFETMLACTECWLAARAKHVPDPAMEIMLNTNLFFAFFYASGRTLDTEELCLMTSRSPRYYVSAAYWDRDSLLWAFPAILAADAAYAREILLYVFTRQSRNFGVHSRYIDGTMLEPGFELDELCAPVIALTRYMEKTADETILRELCVRQGLAHILRTLDSKKHPDVDLYETFLQPTDDLRRYPYLTYDNALVCFSMRSLARFLEMPELRARAEAVKNAVYAHCVKEKDGRRFFAWSVGLQGEYDIYDEPPGSLQLLPFYGFCTPQDEVWKNTVTMIRDAGYKYSFAGSPIAEIGCAHAPYPWVLSVCNSLLCGHGEEALRHLRKMRMDNGIACESVNAVSGECETGEAFATCAGFLAFAIDYAFRTETWDDLKE